MRTLSIETTHPHARDCENFSRALELGLITIIEGEPQIVGRVPDTARVGNILTGECYDSKEFCLNLVIEYCPFCGKSLQGEEYV
jgi:hypothetical protein